ncbi:Uncharacterized protein TCM_027932 [Theobroma cacao]|uniref:Uncharacterized protein n=1 Tax=Theobroma cacao TaxID=3641 RepID=A0A061GAF0_THECC|nr:Uncharacterized protein TCM_027932 [Theobroma cacao]
MDVEKFDKNRNKDMFKVTRPRVDIHGCDHMISPMLANIVETAMAMGIRWKGASHIVIMWKKIHGLIIYDYPLESLESF